MEKAQAISSEYIKTLQESIVEFWNRFVDYVLMTIRATMDNIVMENYVMNNTYSIYLFSGSFIKLSFQGNLSCWNFNAPT